MRRTFYVSMFSFVFVLSFILSSATTIRSEKENKYEFDACTSVIAGKDASVDGSTMTSHSCDSQSDRAWMNVVPNEKHKNGEMAPVYMTPKEKKGPKDADAISVGEIPQVPETYAYINSAYPVMNEHQLAIGETTFVERMN